VALVSKSPQTTGSLAVTMFIFATDISISPEHWVVEFTGAFEGCSSVGPVLSCRVSTSKPLDGAFGFLSQALYPFLGPVPITH
jgi:hypothetical protein